MALKTLSSARVTNATLIALAPKRPARPTLCAYAAASGAASMCATRLTRSRSTPREVRSVDTSTRSSKSRILRMAANRSVCGVAPQTNPALTPLRSSFRASASPRAGRFTNKTHWWNATRRNTFRSAASFSSSPPSPQFTKNCRTASRPEVACVHSWTRRGSIVIDSTRATVSGGYVAENASVCVREGPPERAPDAFSELDQLEAAVTASVVVTQTAWLVTCVSVSARVRSVASVLAPAMARRNSTSASNEPRVSASASSSTKTRTSSARKEPSSTSWRSLPGVPMTTCASPVANAARSTSTRTPPTARCVRSGRFPSEKPDASASLASVACDCCATSLVGATTSACVCATARSTRSSRIAPNVIVLPVPLLAWTTRSAPARPRGMAAR